MVETGFKLGIVPEVPLTRNSYNESERMRLTMPPVVACGVIFTFFLLICILELAQKALPLGLNFLYKGNTRIVFNLACINAQEMGIMTAIFRIGGN